MATNDNDTLSTGSQESYSLLNDARQEILNGKKNQQNKRRRENQKRRLRDENERLTQRGD